MVWSLLCSSASSGGTPYLALSVLTSAQKPRSWKGMKENFPGHWKTPYSIKRCHPWSKYQINGFFCLGVTRQHNKSSNFSLLRDVFKKWRVRGEIMLFTNARLACYDKGRWIYDVLYFPLLEVSSTMVIEQYIVLLYPHIWLQAPDIEIEGKVGWQNSAFVFIGVHGLPSLLLSLLLLPLMHLLVDILAPIFGMEHGK